MLAVFWPLARCLCSGSDGRRRAESLEADSDDVQSAGPRQGRLLRQTGSEPLPSATPANSDTRCLRTKNLHDTKFSFSLRCLFLSSSTCQTQRLLCRSQQRPAGLFLLEGGAFAGAAVRSICFMIRWLFFFFFFLQRSIVCMFISWQNLNYSMSTLTAACPPAQWFFCLLPPPIALLGRKCMICGLYFHY